MKFLSVRDLRGKSGEIWRTLPTVREMVVTSNGRPVAILSAVDESSMEESLTAIRQARAAAAATRLQQGAERCGVDRLTSDEINIEIRAARRSRAR